MGELVARNFELEAEVLRLQQALLEKDAALRETQDELSSSLRISQQRFDQVVAACDVAGRACGLDAREARPAEGGRATPHTTAACPKAFAADGAYVIRAELAYGEPHCEPLRRV